MQIFEASEERRLLSESVHDVFRDFAPMAPKWASDLAVLQLGLRDAFHDLGLETLLVPEFLGGSGLGASEAVTVVREAGRSCLGAPIRETVWCNGLIAALVPEWLSDISSGRQWVVAANVLESSDSRSSGPIICSGVGFAENASWVLLIIHGPDRRQVKSISLVETSHVSILSNNKSVDPQYPVCDLLIPREIAQARMLSDLTDEQRQIAMRYDQLWSLLSATESAGAAEKTRESAVDYLKQRKQFGVVIGSHQALKHLSADDYMYSRNMELAVEYAAASWDRCARDTEKAVATAVLAARVARKVIENSIQLHGGIGFTWELGLHYWLKRAIYLATVTGPELDYCEVLLEEGSAELV